jgi:2,3-bisphosphoglycerate-independent phosphoglycerate mutase
MVQRQEKNSSLAEAIRKAYGAGQEDEALEPIIKVNRAGHPIGRLHDGDFVIFYDIRGEREIELTQSLTNENFNHFPIQKNLNLNFVTMIEYDSELKVRVAFPPEKKIKNTLAEVISKGGLRLVKISESEKAVHVGYFMNGKSDEIFPGEERVVVPSPQGIASYALKPEMSVREVAQAISSKLKDSACDVIVANLANVDVVGHIEDKAAVLRAVEAVDRELGSIVDEARTQKVTLFVTSDHGTVEEWLYPDGAINTGHTRNPVPFVLADFSSEDSAILSLKKEGELADVAPTLLEWIGLRKPAEMTGQSLLFNQPSTPRKKRRVFLLILDGWGMRKESQGNLIQEASTPNFDKLWTKFPHGVLKSYGEAVGMPPHAVGNSEAGHFHLGAGRRIPLDRVKIDKAIEDGNFFQNNAFLWAMEGAKKKHKTLHLLGIVSHYSSHGTIKHLFALLRMAQAQEIKKVYIHSLIGRRGEKPESGAFYVEKVEEECRALHIGEVVTVIGRFWALDREENWDRVEKAYRALVYGEGTKVFPKTFSSHFSYFKEIEKK